MTRRNRTSRARPAPGETSGRRGRLAALVIAALAGVLAIAWVISFRGAATLQRSADRNLLLITIDTLSALHTSLHGYARPTTPRLEEFASGATVFERHYASSNFTTGSVSSLLVGARPWTHRVAQLEATLPERFFAGSLPALLAESGYFTAAVATNAWASPRHLRL